MRTPEESRARAGVLLAGGAFFIWGLVPVYFHWLARVDPFEIIAHRVLWSAAFVALLLAFTRGFSDLRVVLRAPVTLARLALTAALVAANWLTFVWAVNAGRVLETSLGYFITPQVNILLGLVFLGERLRPAQWLAVALAVGGVVNQVAVLGQLPVISLVLAITFGCYGFFRKQIRIDAMTGLFVETLIVAPAALGFIAWRARTGDLAFGRDRVIDGLLIGLGVTTAVPLILFAAGAQRLRLTTVGFMQYLAPSLTFLLAIFFFGEPLGLARALTFILIWAGVAVYILDNWRLTRGRV